MIDQARCEMEAGGSVRVRCGMIERRIARYKKRMNNGKESAEEAGGVGERKLGKKGRSGSAMAHRTGICRHCRAGSSAGDSALGALAGQAAAPLLSVP